MTIFVAGCSTPPKVITVYETVEVVRDRIVSVPERMTAPVEIITLPSDFDLYSLGAGFKAQRVRLLQCNGQLSAIAELD